MFSFYAMCIIRFGFYCRIELKDKVQRFNIDMVFENDDHPLNESAVYLFRPFCPSPQHQSYHDTKPTPVRHQPYSLEINKKDIQMN